MKKAAAILMLSIYMLSFSEFHQFLRVPVLIEHFIEHRAQDRSVSFWAFLKEHYIHQYVVDADYQRDNQLPFRAASSCIVTAMLSCECPVVPIEMNRNQVEIHHEFIIRNEENRSLLSTADIFQPPRTA